jgi:hypothetical protein
MDLILQIYRNFEKKGREESPAFLRKKKGEELTKDGTGSLSSTTTRHPLPFGGTKIEGPRGTGTSSSTTRMRYALGTSSSMSLTCAMPNSSFIVSQIICKNRNIPK